MRGWIICVALVAAGCGRKATARHDDVPLELASAAGVAFDARALAPPAGYDPLALAQASTGKVKNENANIPPVCFTKSAGRANPCWTCHTHSEYPNLADDWEVQQNYPAKVTTNPWRNLFRDRSALVKPIGDADVLAYVRTDNYAPLRAAMTSRGAFPGWRPDIDLARGVDADGFAVDGSGWRALRYKPFPGTFWPTNGSTDDTFVRLPDEFRRDAHGVASRAVYRTNLAILEAAIASDPRQPDAELVRAIEPIDERAGGADLDRDGKLATATRIVGLPTTFVGGAAAVPVTRRLYPAGVEFLHGVRYLDPDAPGMAARRLKELRYAKKVTVVDKPQLVAAYHAAEQPEPPPYGGDPMHGLTNQLGWQLQGWIEDARGWLRLQTQEEHTFCMGCHSNVGVTVDQTFAFARKVPGREGWRMQDAHGIPDAPQVGQTEGEYAQYLDRVAGGDELRANAELAARYVKAGLLDRDALAAMRVDVGALVLPSRSRAIALDRAYLANVIEQSYVWGRDAIATPAENVNQTIDERSTGIGEAGRTVRDGKLQLDW